MKPILEKSFTPFSIIADLIDPPKKSGGKDPISFGKGSAAKFLRGNGNKDIYLGGSISNYANDLIMTFPMLIDNSISPEICSMLSKASERNIVSMLHLLFSSASFNGTDGKEIIRSIYGKVNTNLGMDDYIDKIEDFVNNYKESYHVGYVSHDRETNLLINETVKAIAQCVKEGKIYTPAFDDYDSINESSIGKFEVRKDHNDNMMVMEAKPNDPVFSTDLEKTKDAYGMYRLEPDSILADGPNTIRTANDYAYKSQQLKNAEDRFRMDKRMADHRRRQDGRNYYNDQLNRQNSISMKNYDDNIGVINRRLLDTDVKKANELQPTLMVVNYNEIDPESNQIYDKKAFVCGVKSRLIPVEPTDIIDRIVSKNKTKLSFLNFIRATTGEIGLIKDFILSLDQAKIDARNSVKKGEAAKIWKTLEALSNKNTLNKMRKNGNDASAITTLVISRETVNFIKKQFKIDLDNPKTAKGVIDAYNLLAIYIIDESVEIAKILYRGNNMYEQQAFSYLEKEENDKSYKKVINLIGQMNR